MKIWIQVLKHWGGEHLLDSQLSWESKMEPSVAIIDKLVTLSTSSIKGGQPILYSRLIETNEHLFIVKPWQKIQLFHFLFKFYISSVIKPYFFPNGTKTQFSIYRIINQHFRGIKVHLEIKLLILYHSFMYLGCYHHHL